MQALIVGPADASLFAVVLSTLSAAIPASQVQKIRHPGEIDPFFSPDLVLIFQQWPDEYTQADLLTLIDTAPLARLLVCYGPWCESDGRTRDIWPLGTRVPVSEAAPRLIEELDNLRQGSPPLPLTANRNEIYARFQARSHSPAGKRLSVAVVSSDQVLRSGWEDVLTAAGHAVVDLSSTSADLLLWDADPWDQPAKAELDSLRQARPEVPIAVMMGFLRLHLVREIMAAGVIMVIPKSVDHYTLQQELQRAATKQRISPENSRLSTPLRMTC